MVGIIILKKKRHGYNWPKVNIIVVQPNIDPYNEKFSGNFMEQLNKMLALADTNIDSTTDYVVFPETALTDPDIWENNWEANGSINVLKNYLARHPHLAWLPEPVLTAITIEVIAFRGKRQKVH